MLLKDQICASSSKLASFLCCILSEIKHQEGQRSTVMVFLAHKAGEELEHICLWFSDWLVSHILIHSPSAQPASFYISSTKLLASWETNVWDQARFLQCGMIQYNTTLIHHIQRNHRGRLYNCIAVNCSITWYCLTCRKVANATLYCGCSAEVALKLYSSYLLLLNNTFTKLGLSEGHIKQRNLKKHQLRYPDFQLQKIPHLIMQQIVSVMSCAVYFKPKLKYSPVSKRIGMPWKMYMMLWSLVHFKPIFDCQ